MKYRLLGPIFAFLIAVFYFGTELYLFERPAFPLDDSWIHLQFARHLAEGHGLVYNSGERVNGSTAPLWTAILSLGFLMPGGLPLLWPKVLGIGLLVAGVWATSRLAEALGLGPWAQWMSGLMVAGCHWWVWSALSGMEILLFSTLALWGLILHQREAEAVDAPPFSLAVLAVACLARPEGLLLWVLAVGERLADERSKASNLARGVVVSLMVLAPVLAYNIWVGGSPLPTTFQAKTHTDWNLVPSGTYLRSVLTVLWAAQPILCLLALAGGVRLAAEVRLSAGGGTHRSRRLLPLLWLLGQPLAYAILTSQQGPQPLGNFGRYYFPLIPVVVVLGLAALEPLASAPGLAVRRWRLHWSPVITLALLVPLAFSLWKGPARYLQTVANVEDSDVRMALWLQERLPSGARLAAQDIGALKFFLPDHYFVDLAGIVTPETRKILHGAMEGDSEPYWELQLADFLQQSQVDYLVLFAESYPALSNRPDLGFTVLHQLQIENNVTMAGRTLVVLKAPWSRQPNLQD